MKETDLYGPLREYFEARGFQVRGEVHDVDLLARKEGFLVGVELKAGLTVALLVQGSLRQKVCDLVYLAVPRPRRVRKDASFRKLLYLLRRLELGLFFVDLEEGRVEEVLAPEPYDLEKSRKAQGKRRLALFRELEGRSLDGNLGGSRGRRLLTAYREEALKALAFLSLKGSAAPRDLKALGLNPRLFQDNYYGWFRKESRGVYQADPGSRESWQEYESLLENFRQELLGKEPCQEPDIVL